jgi:hypothetical protein
MPTNSGSSFAQLAPTHRVLEIVILGFFASWIALSLLVYVPSINARIRRLDRFALVPEWRFFAPNPGRHDFHLLFRDKFSDDTKSYWKEVCPISHHGVGNMILNPSKRRNKALFDCTQELTKHINARDKTLELSVPYLTLLNYVSHLPRGISPQAVQFLLMFSAGEDLNKDPDILYVSQFHSL